MIDTTDIDEDLLDASEPVILAKGGSERVGYKYSDFYTLELCYIPSVDRFVVSKGSILGSNEFVEPSLSKAIRKYKRLCESSYEDKEVRDVYDVKKSIIRSVEE